MLLSVLRAYLTKVKIKENYLIVLKNQYNSKENSEN